MFKLSCISLSMLVTGSRLLLSFVVILVIFACSRFSAEGHADHMNIEFKEPEGHAHLSSTEHVKYSGSYCGGSNNLGDGCSISDDCSTITCKMDFEDEPITFKLKVNKCDDPVSATASMEVTDLYITWSHTYTSDDIVEVPGFTASVPSVASAGVYVQVGLTPNGDELHLKVKLLAGGEVMGEGIYPVKATVMEGDLPINTNACGIFGWWYEMGDVGKAAIIGGAILFLIITISLCCCCCCCKSRPTNQGTVIVQPAVGPVMATSTHTTVPMRPLVNEI